MPRDFQVGVGVLFFLVGLCCPVDAVLSQPVRMQGDFEVAFRDEADDFIGPSLRDEDVFLSAALFARRRFNVDTEISDTRFDVHVTSGVPVSHRPPRKQFRDIVVVHDWAEILENGPGAVGNPTNLNAFFRPSVHLHEETV